MHMTKDLLCNIAAMAQIELDHAQKAYMLSELERLLGYMEKLNEVDTCGIEPLVHLGTLTNVMRPDVITPSYDRAALLEQAPTHTEESFVVPRTVE